MTARAQAATRPRYDELTSQARAELAEGRRQSARLMRSFPGWAVMWGSGSREYFAFPMRCQAPMQRSADADDLAEQMLAAEMAAAPAGRWPPINHLAASAASTARERPRHRGGSS